MRLPWRDVAPGDGPAISTSLTAAEAAELSRLAAGARVLEIGTAFGFSTVTMGLAGGDVVTVDPHSHIAGSLDGARSNIAAYGLTVDIRVGASQAVLPELYASGAVFDLVFIDGDHLRAGVAHDVEWGLRLLADDGVLACHDYGEESCPDVRLVLDEVCGAPVRLIDTLYVHEPRGPLVSVITPTWHRHELLLDRCVPSVRGQAHRNVEHVIVSDGPDPDLVVPDDPRIRLSAMDRHDPSFRWGHRARLHGIEQASGEFICYLDDDNSFRPAHVRLLLDALLDNPEAGFSYSGGLIHHAGGSTRTIGRRVPPVFSEIDTSGFMHRHETLDVATWRHGNPTIDWDLIERWLAAGVGFVPVHDVTYDYYEAGVR